MIRLIFVLICIFHCTLCVDRANFKSCKESGFCQRHRNFKPDGSEYSIVPESFQVLKTKVVGNLRHAVSQKIFPFKLTKLSGKMFRLQIDEENPLRPRFVIPIGDTLVSEPTEDTITVQKLNENSYEITGTMGEKATIYFNSFRIDLFLNGIPLISVNAQGKLKYEYSRPKESTSDSTKQESAENSDEATKEEQTQTQPPANEEGMWEETFRGHTDTKPYGPMSVGLDFSFPGFEHVYGIPQHADSLALRNTDSTDPYRLYNLDVFEYELNNPMALYGSVPLMWSHNANNTAGIFWNNPSETWVDIQSTRGSGGALSKILSLIKSSDDVPHVDTHWFSETGVIDAFLFLADNPSEAVYLYGKLTGTTPLPPLYSIAYHQCRWNYNDQDDVLSVDSNFDKYDIPFDVIWLDIEHTESKKYFTWDSSKFPDPVSMVDALDSKRRKLVTVVDPHIKREDGWDLFKDASNKGLFIKKSDGSSDYEGWCWPGSSSWPDFQSEEVRKWWASQFLTYRGSRADNTFTWNDMGEPSIFNGPEVTMHKDAIHSGGWEHRDVHNLYGLQVHRATWDGQLLRSDNNERPFVLTRAFFAGSQRFGATWTGDNKADWSHLKISVPMLLSIGISGVTLVGADVGGFFGNPDAELLTRWYQAGAFQPFFRAHAHLDTKRREPWLLPQNNMLIIRRAIQERYALLPYWYTCFYQSESSNEPVMAPLWFYFPKDSNTYSIDDQYLIGDSILVKPVTDAGATQISIYFPLDPNESDGGRWYFKETWQRVRGGQTINLPVRLDMIPVFYRGGRIIPRKERIRRSSNLARYDPYTFVVLLDSQNEAHGKLYIDDYHTHRYKRQPQPELAFYRLQFKEWHLKLINLDFSGKYAVKNKVERVVIVGLEKRPEAIELVSSVSSPRRLEYAYLPESRLLVIRKPDVTISEDWKMRLIMNKTEL